VLIAATVVLTPVWAISAQTTDHISGPDARADIRQIGDLLERVHPDPYTGFGGRVAFQRTLQDVLEQVPEEGLTVAALRRVIAGFLGELGDGHTGIEQVSSTPSDGVPLFLPVRFSTSADGVYISDAAPAVGEWLGAKVEAAEGIAVDVLARRTHVIFPYENASGSRRRLAPSLASLHRARVLMPDLGDALHLTVVPAGETTVRDVTLYYRLTAEDRRAGPWLRDSVPPVAKVAGPFGHRMLAEGRVGYLRLHAMWSREAFENMRAAGRTDLDRWLTHAHNRFLDSAAVTSQEAAIAGFPSLIEAVDTLLSEMRAAGTHDLIVDLRSNGGGFSVIGEPLLYQLFGDAYLRSPDPVYFATRVSEELLAIDGRTLADLSASKGRDIRLGDFVFDPPGASSRPGRTREQFLSDQAEHGFSRIDLLRRPPAVDLRVVVVCDAATFSAAFDLTYQLHRMGAVMVGIPPSQSPRAFTDATPYELSHSGLKGSMSRSAVVYPGIPVEAGAVVMDEPMTWHRLQTFAFHPDAPLLAALEILQGGREGF
jgi:hypothetical protein